MNIFIAFFLSLAAMAQNSPNVFEKINEYKAAKKSCLIVYGIQEKDKPKLFKDLNDGDYDFFSEEGNLLVTWGDKERLQLKTLNKNKLILDKILDQGFDPNNVPPKLIEQLNLLKELTTKCK